MSDVDKVSAIKKQLGEPKKMFGLFESVALSARNPFVSGVANLQAWMVAGYSTIDDAVEFNNYICPPVYLIFPAVSVNFKVVRKNCAHLFTFYIESSYSQTYEITNNSDITQTFAVQRGSNVVHFAFMPTEIGNARFLFYVFDPWTKTLPWTLRRVEIDVVT